MAEIRDGEMSDAMSYPYLMAASLLLEGTAATLPASPPPQPQEPLPQSEVATVEVESVAVTPAAISSVERPTAEFSSQMKGTSQMGQEQLPGEVGRDSPGRLRHRNPTRPSSLQPGPQPSAQQQPTEQAISKPTRWSATQPNWFNKATGSATVATSNQATSYVVPVRKYAAAVKPSQTAQPRSVSSNLAEIGTVKPESAPLIAFSQPAAKRSPASGSQLYHQRLMALKAGKLHTRLRPDSFWSAWIGAVRQPTYQEWKRLLALEAKAAARGQGNNRLTILLGDSLSLWFPSERLPGRQLWLNQGISGDTAGGIARRVSAFAQTRPTSIYVMAGINDLKNGVSDGKILHNFRQMIRQLRRNHPRSRLIVQSILPTRHNRVPNPRIRNLNQKLASLVQQEGASFLDLYENFTDGQGQMRQDLTTDGLHLSPRGYEVWQAALKKTEQRGSDTPAPYQDWARPANPNTAYQPDNSLKSKQTIAYQKWMQRSKFLTAQLDNNWQLAQRDNPYQRWLRRTEVINAEQQTPAPPEKTVSSR